MHRLSRIFALATLLLVVAAASAGEDASVLVFTRTEGYHHASIDAGVAMFSDLASNHGWLLAVTDDSAAFTPEGLASVDVVVWLNTTGDVLDAPQQDVFEAWLETGGGYLGIHAASDSEQGWPWYGQLLGNGAWFSTHPSPQPARVLRELADAPSTAHLPEQFTVTDEWYSFQHNPRSAATVLLRLDESSYGVGGGAMGDHPISWRRTQGAGKAWYTGMGHAAETYAEPWFVGHVAGAMQWLLAPMPAAVYANGFEETAAAR